MPADPTSVACRARVRARVSACLGAQRGDSLIEVMVAALLVALIAAAALTGFIAIGHSAGTQRNEEQAATLAQQDQARLRGLTITQLSGTGGNGVVTTAIDGTTYQVTSKSQFISGSNGASSCTSGGTSSADEVQTTSTVNWGTGSTFTNGGRAPVVLHGIITPSQGGSLIISATDQTGAGLAGVTATVTGGPTTVSPLTTDSSGCAIFAGLAGGTYTVTYAAPPGYVDNTGKPPANWSGPVTSTQTATATPLVLAQDGAISATFTTFYNGLSQAATSDTFIASNTQMPSPSYTAFGTNNTFSSTITSSTTLFPYAGTNNGYSVYAGGCQAEPPPAGQIQTAVVQPTATTAVVLPLPAMIVDVYATATVTPYDDPVADANLSYSTGWTYSTGVTGDYQSTESTSATLNNTVTLTFTGTGVQWITTKGPAQGIANVTLDATAAVPEDTYKSTTQRQVAMYSISGLANGPHTLTITVTATKNSSSTGNTIAIDEFIVTNAVALETIKPNVTVTETDPGCNNNKDKPTTRIIPDATQGALLSPGEPYGDYTVCADDGVNHNTATVANTNFAAGNVVNIYLGTGSPGLAGGKCP
jgi:type II secretory pathway pseudopilin PulG